MVSFFVSLYLLELLPSDIKYYIEIRTIANKKRADAEAGPYAYRKGAHSRRPYLNSARTRPREVGAAAAAVTVRRM
jgi:hypothetical protein